MSSSTEEALRTLLTTRRERGSTLLPYDPLKETAYDAEELHGGPPPSLDARVFEHWGRHGKASPSTALESVARALHDARMTTLVDETIEAADAGLRIVGFFGGHAALRGSEEYASAARLARALTRAGFVVASGGGPGVMEACQLGSWMASRPDLELDLAVASLAASPNFRDSGWLAAGLAVRARFPCEAHHVSLGIPTWFYGNEPTNVFSRRIFKYFDNAQREATLIRVATAACVFFRGAAGTTSEILNAALDNSYLIARPRPSAMVFRDPHFWTSDLPALPLVRALSRGRAADFGSFIMPPAPVASSVDRDRPRHHEDRVLNDRDVVDFVVRAAKL